MVHKAMVLHVPPTLCAGALDSSPTDQSHSPHDCSCSWGRTPDNSRKLSDRLSPLVRCSWEMHIRYYRERSLAQIKHKSRHQCDTDSATK